MIQLKYIMFELDITNLGVGQAPLRKRVPVFFFEPLTHYEMYVACQRNRVLGEADLVSAGFVQFGRPMGGASTKPWFVSTYGVSESLRDHKLPFEPLADDAKIIKAYPYFHGLVQE